MGRGRPTAVCKPADSGCRCGRPAGGSGHCTGAVHCQTARPLCPLCELCLCVRQPYSEGAAVAMATMTGNLSPQGPGASVLFMPRSSRIQGPLRCMSYLPAPRVLNSGLSQATMEDAHRRRVRRENRTAKIANLPNRSDGDGGAPGEGVLCKDGKALQHGPQRAWESLTKATAAELLAQKL